MKKTISTENAPPAIGPYSQAVEVDRLVFCSGQIPLDQTGKLAEGGIGAQTRQVLTNVSAVLHAAGLSTLDVVKTTVFMKDLSQFTEMNSVYQEFFTADPPARSTVEVSGLPRNALIEIEVVAACPRTRPQGGG
jgi:2-iminobutanoate/2-iminopropanoate deaminase